MEKGILFLVPCVFCEFGSFDGLDAIFDNYKSSFVTEEHLKVFDEAVNMAEEDVNVRRKRDMPSMYMGKKKKLRTCANMNGILGGSNAFNYVSFVLAILTLVVNTNNNINNNNNNLNQANLNTASNNNANANSNNNNANVVNVMPPGKKKRRRRRSLAPHPFDIYETKMCVKSQSSSVTGEMSLAAMFLVQKYLQSQHIGNKKCQKKRICQSLTEITKIGLGGKMLAVGARTMSSLTDFKEFSCDVEDDSFDGCLLNRGGYHHDQEIQCGRCGHGVSNSSNIINVDTDQALSTGMFEIFGKENVTVHEFVNPSNYHFRSFNVNQSTCEAHNHTWHGGSTWYPGMMWRVCHCPVCGQAVGWEWRQEVGGAPDTDQSEWVGLRMGTVSDWSDYLLGPLSDLPQLLQSVGK